MTVKNKILVLIILVTLVVSGLAVAAMAHHDTVVRAEVRTGPSVVADVLPPHPRYVPPRASRSRPPSAKKKTAGCTSTNWRQTLGTDERWVDEHESGLDPTPADVNPSSGAAGLGQLLPSTHRSLGLTVSWDPCEEIHAQRAYMHERYGSWAAARDFWEAHRWW